MPRTKLIINPDYYYFATARCSNREWFGLPMEDTWSLMSDYLFLLHHGFRFEIQAFVLLGNHIHMIVKAPKGNLSDGMAYFMRETSKAIGRARGRINQIWGGPFHKSAITSTAHFRAVRRYLYRNPVEAGIVERIEQYEFSTLRTLLGLDRGIIPLGEDVHLFEHTEAELAWLNTPTAKHITKAIRAGLRRREFQPPKKRSTNKPFEDHELLE